MDQILRLSDRQTDEAVSQQPDALMVFMAALSGKMQALSGCVDAAEEIEKDAETPPVNHPICK